MPRPLIATADAIIGPGIDALVAKRPRALSHINYQTGTYAKVFAGWRAQAALCLRRMADEAKATRLAFAEEDALRDLAADEYSTIVDTSATTAIGQVVLQRSTGALGGGAIKAGHRFRRAADQNAIPAVAAANIVAARDTPVLQGQTSVTVNVTADRAGSFANAPVIGAAPLGALEFQDAPFDPAFAITSYDLGGGSDGGDDSTIRAEAAAYAAGQYAPTADAVLAGALHGTGVRHVAAFEVTRILASGVWKNAAHTTVIVADQSWAGSQLWTQQIAQAIQGSADADGFLGFGCALRVGYPSNTVVAVQPSVVLRDAAFLADTTDIDTAIRKAVVSYFDDRPDWYLFRLAQLRAVIARADRRILTCTSVTVSNQATGAPIAEPSLPNWSGGTTLVHYLVGQNAVVTTYTAPS